MARRLLIAAANDHDETETTTMKTRNLILAAFTCSALLAGCGGADPGVYDSPDVADDGSKEDSRSASWSACHVDSDCVAVATSACCPDADKVAVAKKGLDLYHRTHTNLMVCNEQIQCTAAKDDRVAQCNNSTHHCQMIEPVKVRCGGFTVNPHKCPTGYSCDFPGVPDVPGYCIESSPPPSTCVDNVFCKIGSHWDSHACKCVDNAPNPNDACGGCPAGQYCGACWGNMACLPVGALC
jgi:hypothetical protein